MPPVLFSLVILEIGSCFLPRQAWTTIPLFQAAAGMTKCTPPHPALFFPIEMEVLRIFLPRLLWNPDPPDLSLPRSLG
jgi:hypothetical protein